MYQKIDKMVKELELRGRSQGTIKIMVYTVKNFCEFYNQPPELLGEHHIIDYLYYCINCKKLCNNTVNMINSFLKFFYVVTLEKEWNDLRIPRLKRPKKVPIYLTKAEVDILLNSITNLKHKAILSTIYSSGLRVSEATNLKLSDIMSSEMKIRVRDGKGSKERYTLLSEKNLILLREYWSKYGSKNYSMEDYLFMGNDPSKAITIRTVEEFMSTFIIRSGITKKATPHSLRHSFATHLMNDGVDLLTIKRLLGHSDIRSTLIYLHLKDYESLNIVSPLDKPE